MPLASLARAAAMALMVASTAIPAGCGGATGSTSERRDALVFVSVEQPDASIWVDGRFVAEVAQARGGVALSPGEHRIEIRHDDFHTHYERITVAPRQRVKLEVELARYLP